MDFSDQVELIKASKHVHSTWYRETYPEVAALGLDPAVHYLRYGAELGRNPGKGFDTRFYLAAYPEVAESGLNPLVHFALRGRELGYQPRPSGDSGRLRVIAIRTKLLSLGFTDRPLAELAELLASPDAETRALAARELALWHMRSRTEAGYRQALAHLAQARADAPDLEFRGKLVTAELLCHHHLGAAEAGRACYERAALAGEVTPDATLAWVNFQPTTEARVAWINAVLERFGIEPVTLLPDDGRPPYDRLTCARDLPKIAEGPRVSVLVAAYDAAAMLPTALRSLQEQTWANLEVIVLDDASPTPDTVAVAERFAAADPRIRVIRMEENGGAYVARNRGLDAATGEFITLHDADDWSHPRKIETQVRFMMAHPEMMGCTTRQARAYSDPQFTRWTGQGSFIITNTSSFMFRKEPVQASLGYWDTVRFSADNELVRRIQATFGASSISFIQSGPFSFQRDSASSIVADEVLGINGFLFGARREYLEAQQWFHQHSRNIRYATKTSERPFPAPSIMRTARPRLAQDSHLDLVIASDFRMPGGSVNSCLEEIKAATRHGLKVGLVELFRYDLFGPNVRKSILEHVRSIIDGDSVRLLVFGERASCDTLLIRYPPVLQERQRFVPSIAAKDIRVIVNQTPMSDYGEDAVLRYEIEKCARNVRHYFGKDATWHPIGPLVREALATHHADQLHHVELSDEDWHNIIDVNGWSRAPRVRGPKDRLRIGRHSRDHPTKWPDTREGILAAYPESDDVEVHVLGGGKSAAQIIGRLPRNWVVHDFGSIHPREFLRDIDVWIYFANPHLVESFGRTIIEAMAVGVPVVLPEIYRPLFKEAAVYATPATAVEIARRLHADPAEYDRQVAMAKAYARAHFSYERHIDRLRGVGVGTNASRQGA